MRLLDVASLDSEEPGFLTLCRYQCSIGAALDSGTVAGQCRQMFSHRNHTKAYISLGSNLGDRAGNLVLAVRGMMHAALSVSCLSSIYETEPVSEIKQPSFLNMVAEIGNPLPAPEQVMARLLRIEFALGRIRDVKDGPRTIDLDLLLYGDVQSNTQYLMLPHPRLHERRFVLEPLTEIAPRIVHPTLHRSTTELLDGLEDKSVVKVWAPNSNSPAVR